MPRRASRGSVLPVRHGCRGTQAPRLASGSPRRLCRCWDRLPSRGLGIPCPSGCGAERPLPGAGVGTRTDVSGPHAAHTAFSLPGQGTGHPIVGRSREVSSQVPSVRPRVRFWFSPQTKILRGLQLGPRPAVGFVSGFPGGYRPASATSSEGRWALVGALGFQATRGKSFPPPSPPPHLRGPRPCPPGGPVPGCPGLPWALHTRSERPCRRRCSVLAYLLRAASLSCLWHPWFPGPRPDPAWHLQALLAPISSCWLAPGTQCTACWVWGAQGLPGDPSLPERFPVRLLGTGGEALARHLQPPQGPTPQPARPSCCHPGLPRA